MGRRRLFYTFYKLHCSTLLLNYFLGFGLLILFYSFGFIIWLRTFCFSFRRHRSIVSFASSCISVIFLMPRRCPNSHSLLCVSCRGHRSPSYFFWKLLRHRRASWTSQIFFPPDEFCFVPRISPGFDFAGVYFLFFALYFFSINCFPLRILFHERTFPNGMWWLFKILIYCLRLFLRNCVFPFPRCRCFINTGKTDAFYFVFVVFFFCIVNSVSFCRRRVFAFHFFPFRL